MYVCVWCMYVCDVCMCVMYVRSCAYVCARMCTCVCVMYVWVRVRMFLTPSRSCLSHLAHYHTSHTPYLSHPVGSSYLKYYTLSKAFLHFARSPEDLPVVMPISVKSESLNIIWSQHVVDSTDMKNWNIGTSSFCYGNKRRHAVCNATPHTSSKQQYENTFRNTSSEATNTKDYYFYKSTPSCLLPNL